MNDDRWDLVVVGAGPAGAATALGALTADPSLRVLLLDRGVATVERSLDRPVWVIPRKVFDARLVERATTAGARLVRHRVRDVRADGHGFTLDDRYGGRVLVAADGAHSVVRTAAGEDQQQEAEAQDNG